MVKHERTGNLSVWWFPKEFCQSRYGEYQASGTNSCTLISLLLADKVAKLKMKLQINTPDLPRRVVDLFAASINEGNGAYYHLINAMAAATSNKKERLKLRNHNLNIPDAMQALRVQANFELQEWFYTHMPARPSKESFRDIAKRLDQIFSVAVGLFRRQGAETAAQYLFAALIADYRTVVFVFEYPANVITFFDSHQHGSDSGAVVAQCSYTNSIEIIQWFINMLRTVYSSQPTIYEISFLATEIADLQMPDQITTDT